MREEVPCVDVWDVTLRRLRARVVRYWGGAGVGGEQARGVYGEVRLKPVQARGAVGADARGHGAGADAVAREGEVEHHEHVGTGARLTGVYAGLLLSDWGS